MGDGLDQWTVTRFTLNHLNASPYNYESGVYALLNGGMVNVGVRVSR